MPRQRHGQPQQAASSCCDSSRRPLISGDSDTRTRELCVCIPRWGLWKPGEDGDRQTQRMRTDGCPVVA
eukprot:3940244-Rhodomonas_salina.2